MGCHFGLWLVLIGLAGFFLVLRGDVTPLIFSSNLDLIHCIGVFTLMLPLFEHLADPTFDRKLYA